MSTTSFFGLPVAIVRVATSMKIPTIATKRFMSVPRFSAILALVGLMGLLATGVAHAGPLGDLIFNIATACLVVALVIFLGWFTIEARKAM
jgi:hypothetical protein